MVSNFLSTQSLCQKKIKNGHSLGKTLFYCYQQNMISAMFQILEEINFQNVSKNVVSKSLLISAWSIDIKISNNTILLSTLVKKLTILNYVTKKVLALLLELMCFYLFILHKYCICNT